MENARQPRGRTRGSLAVAPLLALGLLAGSLPLSGSGMTMASARAGHMAPVLVPAAGLRSAGTQVAIDQLPMIFEANQGQANAGVRYLAQGNGYALYLTDTDAVLVAGAVPAVKPGAHAAGPATLRFHLQGASTHPRIVGLDQQQSTVNYFLGSGAGGTTTGIATYGRVAYQNVYPGMSMVYYGTRGKLEYDLRLAAGTTPAPIAVSITGNLGLTIDARGDLLISSSAGVVTEHAPLAYQIIGGQRRQVAARYVLHGQHLAGMILGAHNARYPLTIDPTLEYSDLFGSNTGVAGIALDRAGDAYFAGTTYTTLITTTASYQALTSTLPALRPQLPPAFPSSCPSAPAPCPVAYVAKLNSKGTGLLYKTYIGGLVDMHVNPQTGGYNYATGLAVDAHGSAYVVGYSNATDFPTTANIPAPRSTNAGGYDAFLVKVSANGGKLVYATLLGGTTDNQSVGGDDIGTSVAVDESGQAFITGYTYTYNFPVQGGLAGRLGYGKGTLGGQVDAFVTKFSPDARRLIFSTYLGGSGTDTASAIALDPSGEAYVAGQTTSTDFLKSPGHALQTALPASGTSAFVVKLNKAGNDLVYGTYLGQSAADVVHGLAVDGKGNAYVVGETNGGMPQTAATATPAAGGTDGFVAKLSARGVLIYSTYLGGSGNDIGYSVALDGRGNAYVAGSTGSAEFTVPKFPTKGALQGQIGGTRGGFGMLDAFVAKVNSCGSGLLYSSYFGGTFVDAATAIAVDGGGNAYVGGSTLSPNFPLSSNAPRVRSIPQGSVYRPAANNAFVAKIVGTREAASGACPIALSYAISATQLSIASTVPLTVTLRTAPFARVSLTLAVKNTVPPPPPPTPAPQPTVVPGHKAVKIKPPKLPHYPKVGDVIYRLRLTGTADAYGLYVGVIHPKTVLTVVEPATLSISVTGSHSTVASHTDLTVGP